MFALGLCAGAFGMDALHVRSRPLLARSLRTSIEIEEELLASRAARENRLTDSLVHRANAAASWSGEGFKALDRTFADLEETRFLPLVLWAIHHRSGRAHPDPKPDGRRCYGAVLWHQVVLTLEALDLPQEAAIQHQRISDDLPCEYPVSTFEDLVAAENSATQIEVETLVLDRE